LKHTSLESLNPKDFILIKGARVNNLKNLSVAIPRNRLIVISGVSGSGKSSLAFDTLFAEGQRMYVESLSAYARQFLGRMEKPEVDYIRGVSPAIAIEQKVNTRNPRSTVGTTTEIYDYLKLLFARIGKTYSPVSGQEVKRHTVTEVVAFIQGQPEGTRVLVACPLPLPKGRKLADEFGLLLSKGFARVLVNGETRQIEELLEGARGRKSKTDPEPRYEVLIDRATANAGNEDVTFRLADSVQTAFYEGHGECVVYLHQADGYVRHVFSDRFECDGMQFTEPSVNFFSFNNPYGACQTCEGFGKVLGIDEDLVIPDKSLSVYEGAIAPWRGDVMSEWAKQLIRAAIFFDFPIHRPYAALTRQQQKLLWTGNEFFSGLNAFFSHLESRLHKVQNRVMLARYRGRTTCPDCQGTRLRKDAGYVKINGVSIIDLVLMPVDDCLQFFNQLQLPPYQQQVAQRLLTEITFRLAYLQKVGLGYLTLNRLTGTLSGGEFQRIKLATALGSALVGSMYIMDEPSIGLHPKDTERMVEVLLSLRDLGNTVIVVEHEEEIMRAADQLIDIGPDAGRFGGELVFQGPVQQLPRHTSSHTIRYLNGEEEIPLPAYRRSWKDRIRIVGARENNLKNLTVDFPLGVFTVITGISGSGKSTLVRKILYPAIGKMHGVATDAAGKYDRMEGDYATITQVEFIDQNPIGKSSRSNPVSYVKAYDAIRQLYTNLPLSQQRDYLPATFSFNVEGGRCDACEGEGVTKVEMQFMADIFLTCEACRGKRFKQEVLEVSYEGKNIADVLSMTVDEAMVFFQNKKQIQERIMPLAAVGLNYIQLGQSSNSLSGGEAQRVKLASFLGRNAPGGRVLFIFDEPTTGLHFHDISKLLKAIQALVNEGHTVVVIEHNLEMIKCADWVIDLGPEAGDKNGGHIVFAGTPEELAKSNAGYTGRFLRAKLRNAD
jgi:excinuclease ABC subunit A